jgi:hypothetical protein
MLFIPHFVVFPELFKAYCSSQSKKDKKVALEDR